MSRDISIPPNPFERMKSHYDGLSRTQKRVADLLIESGNGACFLSLKDLSMKAKVSTMTVIRFSKLIGYDSFLDMKKDIQTYLQWLMTTRSIFGNTPSDSNFDSLAELLNMVTSREEQLVQETYRTIGRDKILEAVHTLVNARKIFLVAVGLSLPVAEMLHLRLMTVTLESEIITLGSDKLLAAQLARVMGVDACVIVSFPNYDSRIGYIARCIQEIGAKTICITDSTSSPLASYADILLLCQTSNVVFYNSMTAPVSLVNLITSLLAFELEDRVSETNQRIATISKCLVP